MTSPLVVPVEGYMTLSRFDSFTVCPSTSTFCSRGDMGPGCPSCGATSRIGRSGGPGGWGGPVGAGPWGGWAASGGPGGRRRAVGWLGDFCTPQSRCDVERHPGPPECIFPPGPPQPRAPAPQNPYRSAPALVLGRRCVVTWGDRKSTRLNSSHVAISYAVCCLKKK